MRARFITNIILFAYILIPMSLAFAADEGADAGQSGDTSNSEEDCIVEIPKDCRPDIKNPYKRMIACLQPTPEAEEEDAEKEKIDSCASESSETDDYDPFAPGEPANTYYEEDVDDSLTDDFPTDVSYDPFAPGEPANTYYEADVIAETEPVSDYNPSYHPYENGAEPTSYFGQVALDKVPNDGSLTPSPNAPGDAVDIFSTQNKVTTGSIEDWQKAGVSKENKAAIELNASKFMSGVPGLEDVEFNKITPEKAATYGDIQEHDATGAFAKMMDEEIAPDLYKSADLAGRQQLAMSYLVNVADNPPNIAAAKVGNYTKESVELSPLRDAGGSERSTGLGQWNAASAAGERRQSLEEYADKQFTGFYTEGSKQYFSDGPGFFTQLSYGEAELNGTSPQKDAGAIRVGTTFAQNPNMSVADATQIFQNGFERPQNRTASLPGRITAASNALTKYISAVGDDAYKYTVGTPTAGNSNNSSSGSGGNAGNSSSKTFSSILAAPTNIISNLGSYISKITSPFTGSSNNNTSSYTDTTQNPETSTIAQLYTSPKTPVVTDFKPAALNTSVTSDLSVIALRSENIVNKEYRFISVLSRTFFNPADGAAFSEVGSYFGSTIEHTLLIDLDCDDSVDIKQVFATPYYSILARSDGADILLSEHANIPRQGLHCFAFDVDTNEQISETNESNNQSNWREFITGFDANKNNDELSGFVFEVSVYSADGNLTRDWTSSDITISEGQQLAFRWDAPQYQQCHALLASLTPDVAENLSPVDRNTLSENIDLHEHTGYYEVRCSANDTSAAETILVTVE